MRRKPKHNILKHLVLISLIILLMPACPVVHAAGKAVVQAEVSGYVHYRAGRYEKAIYHFNQAKKIDARYAPVYNSAGLAYLKVRNYRAAYDNFSKAFALDGQNSVYKIHALEAKYKLFANAKNNYSALASLKVSGSNYALVANEVINNKIKKTIAKASISQTSANTASIFTTVFPIELESPKITETDQVYAMIKEVRSIIDREPRNIPAFELLGALYESINSMDLAKGSYVQALQLFPDNANVLNRLGVIRTKENNYTEAESLYNRAMELDPGNSEIHSNYGCTLLLTGNAQQAVQELKTSIKLDPYNTLAYKYIGLYYLNNQEYYTAVNYLKTYISASPPSVDSEKIVFILKEIEKAMS